MVEAGVDNIVLGCSHYPFLIEQIKNIVPSTTTIIDSGAAVAKQTKNMLEIHNLRSKNPDRQTQFYTNADVEILNFFLRQMSVTSFKSSYLKF